MGSPMTTAIDATLERDPLRPRAVGVRSGLLNRCLIEYGMHESGQFPTEPLF